MTLKQLRAFIAVAQHGSFVEASRSLHLTQAALSNTIRDLESQIGFLLFERTTRKVNLSSAGNHYYSYALKVIAAMQEADRCAFQLKNKSIETVRVAASRLVNWSLMPDLFSSFKKKHPNINLIPIDVLIQDIRTAVEDGRADIAIGVTDDEEDLSSLEHKTLFKSKIYAVCSAENQIANQEIIPWEYLNKNTTIFIGRSPIERLKRELKDTFNPNNHIEVGDVASALAVVSAGSGILICPGFVKPLANMHNLRMIECAAPKVIRKYSALTRKNEEFTPAIQDFKKFLINHFSKSSIDFIEV